MTKTRLRSIVFVLTTDAVDVIVLPVSKNKLDTVLKIVLKYVTIPVSPLNCVTLVRTSRTVDIKELPISATSFNDDLPVD